MTITLTPETGSRLREQAERMGKDVSSLADTLIADGLESGAFSEASTDDPDTLTDEQRAEIRVGIRRGLDASAAGHVKPLSQAVAEARERHAFPATWASAADGTA